LASAFDLRVVVDVTWRWEVYAAEELRPEALKAAKELCAIVTKDCVGR